MRLLRRVAEIVVETAFARIGPVDDAFDGGEPFRLAGERCRFGETCGEPSPVVQGRLEAVERRAAANRDRTISLDEIFAAVNKQQVADCRSVKLVGTFEGGNIPASTNSRWI